MERPDRVALLIKGKLHVVTAAATLLVATAPEPGACQTLTQDQALALAFPQAEEIQRRTAFLDKEQTLRISREVADASDPPSSIVTHYVAFQDDRFLGVAYFDVHRVRTLDQVLMVVVGLDQRVLRVETVRFREPPEYRPPQGWLSLFRDRKLDPDLSLKGEIPTITGATLTARAVAEAVRRTLAIHRELAPFQESAEEGAGGLLGGRP